LTPQGKYGFNGTVFPDTGLRIEKSEVQIVGGLHKNDFLEASENEPSGYVLVCFRLEVDGRHWQAIYQLNRGQFP